MQAESEGICLEDFESSLIPIELLPCNTITRSTDSQTIVELGKQLFAGAKNGDTDLVRNLMCKGAPFTTDWLGTSALHVAAQNNHTETAEVLLRAGISRDARTKVDRTPLHMAAYEGHVEMTQLLLNYGADVDSKDMLKMTPLHWSVEREHPEVMVMLLEHGADPHSLSKFNKSPISLALENDRLDLVELLKQEREILHIKKNQIDHAEIEAATQNLLHLENEHQKEEQMPMQLEEQLQKKKVTPVTVKKQKITIQKIKVQTKESNKNLNDQTCKGNQQSLSIDKKQKLTANCIGIEQLKFLQAHGITMIPMDEDSTIVENAMESGQTVVLTEAGKLALNLTKSPNSIPIKRLQVNKNNPKKKLITIRADQIISQNVSPITSRGPNILKKTNNYSKNMGNIFLNAPTIPTLKVSKTASKTMKNTVAHRMEPLILQLEEDEAMPEEESNSEEISAVDISELENNLKEAEKEVLVIKAQLKKKEEEVELYKQQLKSISTLKVTK